MELVFSFYLNVGCQYWTQDARFARQVISLAPTYWFCKMAFDRESLKMPF